MTKIKVKIATCSFVSTLRREYFIKIGHCPDGDSY
jgi:hypothetical protein